MHFSLSQRINSWCFCSRVHHIVRIISETLIGILRMRQTWDRYLIVLLTDHVLFVRRHIACYSLKTHALVEPLSHVITSIFLSFSIHGLCLFYSEIQSFFFHMFQFVLHMRWTCLFIRIEFKCFVRNFIGDEWRRVMFFFSILLVVLSWKELDEDTMHVFSFDVHKRIAFFFEVTCRICVVKCLTNPSIVKMVLKLEFKHHRSFSAFIFSFVQRFSIEICFLHEIKKNVFLILSSRSFVKLVLFFLFTLML